MHSDFQTPSDASSYWQLVQILALKVDVVCSELPSVEIIQFGNEQCNQYKFEKKGRGKRGGGAKYIESRANHLYQYVSLMSSQNFHLAECFFMCICCFFPVTVPKSLVWVIAYKM